MPRHHANVEDFLFHEGDWHATQEAWQRKMLETIAGINGDELLNTSTEDLVQHYVSENTFAVPKLDRDNIEVEQSETQIDVSQDPRRWIDDRSRPVLMPGTAITVEVPFSGNEVGFRIQPSTRNFNNPRARVSRGQIIFTVSGTNLAGKEVTNEINRTLDSIEQHLGWLENDAKGFNSRLEQVIRDAIEARKSKLLNDRSLVAGLGFKMKERPDSRKTYAAPTVQRKIRTSTPRPTGSRRPFKPEPVLTDNDYKHILSTLENMASVMEQSPSAFREIDEESLRTHFLVHLNGHFDGGATGETFNYEGKTDILVKVNGRNIFIGECKFWTGQKGYLETIDQILSYLSWRDTKAAILVFSRNKDFTGVLDTIGSTTIAHPNCKKLIKKRSETSATYLFGHKDDANREILITVQAYNVPDRIEPRVRAI